MQTFRLDSYEIHIPKPHGILAAERVGLTPIKLNAVIIRVVNEDELLDLARLSLAHAWHIRFIEVMPIGNAQNWGEGFPAPDERYVSAQEMRARLSPFDLQPETAICGNGPARCARPYVLSRHWRTPFCRLWPVSRNNITYMCHFGYSGAWHEPDWRIVHLDHLSVVIQAGGASLRMGQDKALMLLRGKPLIQWVAERVQTMADELLVIANQPGGYAFLNLPTYSDILPGRGPLGGLYTALSIAQSPLVAMVACDMPFVNADLLAFERDELLLSGADVVIPANDKGLEPFHAVYRRETCLRLVEDAIQIGEMRLVAWLKSAKVRYLTQAEIAVYDPQQMAFYNLNTPEEFTIAKNIAGLS